MGSVLVCVTGGRCPGPCIYQAVTAGHAIPIGRRRKPVVAPPLLYIIHIASTRKGSKQENNPPTQSIKYQMDGLLNQPL